MTGQEKKKGRHSRLDYPVWAYRILKESEALYLDIGRNQIKHRHDHIEIHCSNEGQCRQVRDLLGMPMSVEIKPEDGKVAYCA